MIARTEIEFPSHLKRTASQTPYSWSDLELTKWPEEITKESISSNRSFAPRNTMSTTTLEFASGISGSGSTSMTSTELAGLTITFTAAGGNISAINAGGLGGSTTEVAFASGPTTSMTVSFSVPVDITSLLHLDPTGFPETLTFTPTGGSNSSVNSSHGAGSGNTVNLNWTGVTSFTITGAASSGQYAIDKLQLAIASSSAPEINVKQSTTDIVSGGNHAFGSVQIGAFKDVVFTVENTGDADLDITSITPSGTGYSIQSGISADPISAAGSATFTVRFQPTATSQGTGSVTIGNDDADEGSYVINFTGSATNATLDITVFLEGPLQSSNTMLTTISGSVPKDPNDVYSAVLEETAVSSLPTNAVDWVEVELRTGTAASTKVGTNRAGILKNDGTIVDKDGNAFTMSQVDGSGYYIVIHHRNHLSVMSNVAVTTTTGTYSFNFTTAQGNSFNNGSIAGGTSRFAMIGGDADGSGTVDGTDLSTWRTNNGAVYSYSGNGNADFNLDGEINAVDRNDFQQKNTSKTRQVPTT
ncbi:choice-of-anchor D domain-containing protein [Roseivirga misakiensis]|uniref:Abnormal spindle-like microcephaly-associated protein ASH domain-containing protein n=1 Tax=Roseivirga misakiensis TaxID=1563681 RepID=A0A1E5T8E5_9BACT|nr:choice-of-anchor D domain-containing protein [Roseivirga misakiensis]OEK07640.1 hypothetical protein BFP71_00010 [Roseivirga misakiensis]